MRRWVFLLLGVFVVEFIVAPFGGRVFDRIFPEEHGFTGMMPEIPFYQLGYASILVLGIVLGLAIAQWRQAKRAASSPSRALLAKALSYVPLVSRRLRYAHTFDMTPKEAPEESPDDAASPLAETHEDRKAKHDLAVFVAEHIIPTYKATANLQESIVRTICDRYTVIAELALKEFQNDENMRKYIQHIETLERVVKDGIADIPLHELVDNVCVISELHHALCSFNNWLVFSRNGRVGPPFDYKSNKATAELYRHWRRRQTSLVEAFQPFRRDIRFPRFYDLSGRRGVGHPFETDA